MPYKSKEDAKRNNAKLYKKRCEKSEASPKKLCSCGCGHWIPSIKRDGSERYYDIGHQPPLPEGHVPKRVAEAELIECACGCGETLPDRNKYGNKRNYIHGHGAKRKWPNAEPPISLLANKESKKAVTSRKSKWAQKLTILRYYSGGETIQCACCGITDPVFLAIDHIDGKGNEHRKKLGIRGGYAFYTYLVKNNFPKGYRVLCHNCNMAMGILGYCPHRPPPEVLEQEEEMLKQEEILQSKDSN